jgi:hypothetical protein
MAIARCRADRCETLARDILLDRLVEDTMRPGGGSHLPRTALRHVRRGKRSRGPRRRTEMRGRILDEDEIVIIELDLLAGVLPLRNR